MAIYRRFFRWTGTNSWGRRNKAMSRLLVIIALALNGAVASAAPAKLLVRNAMLVTLEDSRPEPFPGFLSGHSHLASSVMRGIGSSYELDGMIDFRPTFLDGRFYEQGDVYAFTLHGALDYLLHGITTCFSYPNRRSPPQFYNEGFLA